jgi:hypothetical protein
MPPTGTPLSRTWWEPAVHGYARSRNVAPIHAERGIPRLLGAVGDEKPREVDEQGIAGGFAVFILMTKVPGKPVTSDMLKSKTFEEREEMRQALKTALKWAFSWHDTFQIYRFENREVWKHGFNLKVCEVRNLMWNEESRKWYVIFRREPKKLTKDWHVHSYIVDFEDYAVVNAADPEA